MKKVFSFFAMFFLIFAFSCNHDTTPENPETKNKDIVISSVKVATQECVENAEITVDGDEAEVEVEFAESYSGLTVKIGGKNASPTGKIAKAKITGIIEVASEFKIEAKATGKNDKIFKFKVKKGISLPMATIKELTFEGEEINPTASYDYRNKKTYSSDSTKPPLLSDIANDGSTKVGDSKGKDVKIKVYFNTGATEQKLKVENTTTGKSSESGTPSTDYIELSIALKAGDNNLVITYSEKDKKPLVYKVIVGYKEPDYLPIDTIKVNNERYSQISGKLKKLEVGNETLTVEGITSADVEIIMPKIWFDEDGWNVALDDKDIPKTEFVENGFSVKFFTAKKKFDLNKDNTKELKIVFKNTTRSYEKTYKLSITHRSLNKIESLISIESKNKTHVDTNRENGYAFDATKQYYKTKTKVSFKDRMEKGTFLVTPQDKTITPQYVFSNAEVAPSTLTFQAMTKKSITYNNYSSISVETYVIEEHAINYAPEFLYVLLEKDGVKTYYVTEIVREKIVDENAEKEAEEKIYQNVVGEKVEDTSPIAKKGLIRVLPKSPRAKVKLITPIEQDFTLNASDGYYECTIDLIANDIPFSYKIVAENTTNEEVYNGMFKKSLVIKEVKFDYKEEKTVNEVDGKYYLAFNKKEVNENKLYFFISCYKGVEVQCSEFLEPKKVDEFFGRDYIVKLDVSSLVSGTDAKKEYTANLTLGSESLGTLQLTVYPEDDIIESIYIGRTGCKQLPDFKYLCKANLDSTKPRKVEVSLRLLDEETPENTNRKIKILESGVEKAVTLNPKEKTKIEFVHDGITITDKQKITLTIEYYAKKDDTSPTRTYTLEIEDI